MAVPLVEETVAVLLVLVKVTVPAGVYEPVELKALPVKVG